MRRVLPLRPGANNLVPVGWRQIDDAQSIVDHDFAEISGLPDVSAPYKQGGAAGEGGEHLLQTLIECQSRKLQHPIFRCKVKVRANGRTVAGYSVMRNHHTFGRASGT